MTKKLIICLMSLVLLTGCGAKTLEYTYDDNFEPGSTTFVSVDYKKKTLYVKATYHCSMPDCEETTMEGAVNLTKEEVKLIKKITADDYSEERLTTALIYLSQGDKTLVTMEDETWAWYMDADSNSDNKVTYRENGLFSLNEMIDNPLQETK